jgi:HlyD family secretion protein
MGGVVMIVVVSVAVIGVIVAVVAAWPGDDSQAAVSRDDSWYTVQNRSFNLSIVAKGELEADKKVEIKSAVEGMSRIITVVDEGTTVKKGDVLVELAQDTIIDKIQQEQLSVESARASAVAAEQTLDIQRNQAESDIKKASLDLDLARLDLSKWEQGTDPQRIRELKLSIDKAQRELVRTERDVELSKQLYAEKFISLSELEQDEIDAIEARSALATAELDLKVYESFTRPKEERQFQSDVEQKEAELTRTRSRNASELAQKETDLKSKTNTLRIREDNLKKLQAQLEATVIRAPEGGLVVYASSVGPSWRRQQAIAPGREVRFNEDIIILPDTRNMVAVLNVSEALIGQVSPGQRATISVDSQSGPPIEGTVKQVGVMAQSGGWMNPDLREYSVRVVLPENAGTEMKPGMRANGEIMTGRVDNAIAIPVQAVFTEGDTHFCYVPASGGKVQRQTVTLGQANESFVAITTGLNPGDRVLLRRPKPSELSKEELEAMEKVRRDDSEPTAEGEASTTTEAATPATPAPGAGAAPAGQRRERPAGGGEGGQRQPRGERPAGS